MEIVEKRDDHTRVWEIVREVETTHPDGTVTVDTVKSYIHEKGSGLCYKDASGAYVPSVAEWRETRDGFVIDRCPYRLVMGKTIGTSARYTVEGNDLLLRPAYLIISDGVNQADPRPLTPQTPGCISPDDPSVLRFPSAFGEGYDVEYIAEKGGFHQNLIIANPPQIPAGFDSQSTSIHLYTELNLDQYLSACGGEVTVEGEPANATAADLVTEPSRGGCISFNKDGRLLHAFSVSQVTDSSGPGALDKQTAAEKRLMKDPASGRSYLVESVPFSYFAANSPAYPITWDYESRSGSIGTQTWETRYTYRITGNVTVSGTLTILPGTTVKLDPSKKITMAIGGKVIAKGAPYNYITFTKSSDNNCGEIITGPADQAYDEALEILSGSSSQSVVQYCKIGRGNTGMSVGTGLVSPIAHNVFRYNTYYGIRLSNCTTPVHNNLITDSQYGIYGYYYSYSSLTNNTIDNCSYAGIYTSGAWGLSAYDNIFTDCYYGVYASGGNVSVDHCAWEWYATYMYGVNLGEDNVNLYEAPYDQSSTFGSYYLSEGGVSDLGEAGSRSASDAGLDAEVFTLRAPEEVTATEYKDARVWDKITYRDEQPYSLDTGQVAIGYHHSRTDRYLRSALTVRKTAGSLTVAPGAVIAVKGDKYLTVTEGAKLLCVGDPGAGGYNQLTCGKAASMNIESPRFGDTTGNPYILLDPGGSESSGLQYTRFTWLGWGVMIGSGRWLREPIQHNVFSLSYYGIHAGVDSGNVLFNNLFYDNVQAAYAEGDAQGRASVRNCTFDKNTTGLRVYAGSGETLPITDCLFTNSLAEGILINAGAGTIANDYNGYYGNAQDIDGGTWGQNSWSDKQGAPHPLTQSPYYSGIEAGWQLRYRLNQSCPLVDAGSRTSIEAGLDIFTTSADGRPDFGTVPEGERGNSVDIGYHFPIGGSEGILYQGYRQTDVFIRWNGMDNELRRWFALEGNARDETGTADGMANIVTWYFGKYNYNYLMGTGEHEDYDLKFGFAPVGVFNGSSSKVNIGNSNDPNTGIRNLPQFTLTAWVFVATGEPGNNGRIYDKELVRLYVCDKTDTTVKLKGELGTSSVTSSGTISLDTWTHLAMTWNASSIQLYKNGASCSGQVSATQPDDSAYDAIIGNDAGGDNGFYGRIADVGLYGRALSATEVAWLALCKDPQVSGFVCTANLGAMGRYSNYPVGQMHSVAGVVQDGQGNIWVSEFGTPRVTKFSYEGTVLDIIGGTKSEGNPPELGKFYGPWGLAVDADDNLYVCDCGNWRIQVFDQNGENPRSFGSRGTGDGEFEHPDFCEVIGNYIYVSDDREGNRRLQKFTLDGLSCWRVGEDVTDQSFTGTGQDDMRVYQKFTYLYSDKEDRVYIVRIESTGSPSDTFIWSDDNGEPGSWSAEKAITDIEQGRPQYVHDLSHNIRIKFLSPTGHTAGDKWTFTRRPEQLASPEGLAADGQGNLWVIDKGDTGDRSCLKKFTAGGDCVENFYRDWGTHPDYFAHGLDYYGGNLFSCHGELSGDDTYFNGVDAATGQTLAIWGKQGTGPSEHLSGMQCSVIQHESQHTLLGTDWFVCKVSEWDLNGKWLRTIQSSLRSDAYCIKCKNPNAGAEQLYQRVDLAEGHYKMQFLAFTNGESVTQADIEPFAATAGSQTNLVSLGSESYQSYVVTQVAFSPPGDRWACFVQGEFTVGSGQCGLWDVGVQVQGKTEGEDARRVYIASVTCFKTGDL
ncbi:MAG: LamG-like jellyroll fold domain-containing protein [bacterium]|nr:LamG-like jellyroll fold domain-containing protein [bacterium]